jgi:hypothetical protein
MPRLLETANKIGGFGAGIWHYWRSGKPAPESNFLVQKLYVYTDGRSNDFLFRILESKRKETSLEFAAGAPSLVSDAGASDPSVEEVARTLRQDGVVVIPPRLKPEAIQNLGELALSCPMATRTFAALPAGEAAGNLSNVPVAEKSTSNGFDPSNPRYSVYEVPRKLLLENPYLQRLLCDPYLLAVATRYLGVFPVVTKPDMWWDTDVVAPGLRPRPFHTDSGCLRWIKVGIPLTDTTLETPHFVYVKGSHRPNKITRPLTRRLARSMNLSDKEVRDFCGDKIVHVTAPAGSIILADTRGIHKGELAERGHRLVLYFGLEGSAFNNIDQPVPITKIGNELEQAMAARPFSYQFFQAVH